jgi:4-diphosphocytidyl-2-C-methyl-D-erythritol kinase
LNTAAGKATNNSHVRRFAGAKINLYLQITGKRADGFHLLDSLVVFADVGDEIAVWPADDLVLEISGRFGAEVPQGADNLVLKAARALAQAAGIPPKARIGLRKQLPVASGIGGGSSNAAAALAALAALWRLDLSEGEMDRIALLLGADVPVCRRGRAQHMTGIGEILAPVPGLPALPVVLVNPGITLPTAQVFASRTGGFSKLSPFPTLGPNLLHWIAAIRERDNDLQAPALKLAPEIAMVLEAVADQRSALLARMSGSGATCFGIFPDLSAARAAAGAIGRAHPSWWVEAGSAA